VADPKHSAFEQFLIDRYKDIRRIANSTRRDFTVEDVSNQAWIFAVELSQDGDVETSIVDPAFQDKVISYLYQYFVRYTEKNVRHALRLDQQASEDGPADQYGLLDHLPTNGLADPLTVLLALESAPSEEYEPDPLQTQAGAYYYLLGRHGGAISNLASHLLISKSHCYRCYGKARRQAESQWAMDFGPADQATAPPLKPWRKFRAQRGRRQIDVAFQTAILC
jgi:hypothetical protein